MHFQCIIDAQGRKLNTVLHLKSMHIYASPSSVDAYCDRQLTPKFELWVEIFCLSTCFHMRIPKPCLSVAPSVCPYPEKRNHPGFVNISPTSKIFTSTTARKPKNLNFFPKEFEIEFWLVIWLVPKRWNHLSFVNISPTLVIDTWMERSSWVLQHGNPKNWISFRTLR